MTRRHVVRVVVDRRHHVGDELQEEDQCLLGIDALAVPGRLVQNALHGLGVLAGVDRRVRQVGQVGVPFKGHRSERGTHDVFKRLLLRQRSMLFVITKEPHARRLPVLVVGYA